MTDFYSIGELARLSGVSVQTIRFYSNEGLLPPSKLSEAGYRLYTDDDRLKLELIRTLRGLDIDLASIRQLLQQEQTLETLIELQLAAVEAQIKSLQRSRTVLKALETDASPSRLTQLELLSRFNRLEREAFAAQQLARGFDGVAADPLWQSSFWQAATQDFPETLTESQLRAWLELAELLTDDSFLAWMRQTGHHFWEQSPDFNQALWQEEHSAILHDVHRAIELGHSPCQEMQIIHRLVNLYASVRREQLSGLLVKDILEQFERHDARAERFWELIAIIKGWPQQNLAMAQTATWLSEGLTQYLEQLGD